MDLTNEWFYYTAAIDKKTCNKIKNLGKDNFKAAKIDKNCNETTAEERKTGRVKDVGEDKKNRVSHTSWTNEQWVIDLIWPYMLKANEKSGWNFDIVAVEPIQITKYETGGFYSWHIDGGSDCLSVYDKPGNKFLHGNVRKLSMTILLNGNYQGGDFQFSNYSKLQAKVETPDFKSSGSVMVFPSFLEHSVAPVTKGTRYSLVAWFLGPPFK
jgi:PKHD-type hydroxylase|tara:strand:- start:23 stop:658 length:636 start_codon:yes stop_codon:yes gene_type:complete